MINLIRNTMCTNGNYTNKSIDIDDKSHKNGKNFVMELLTMEK